MDTKNYTQVLIDGKIYTLGGSEDESYLQKAASYVNEKNAVLRKLTGFTKQSADYQIAMVELNMADDYFKALERAETMERLKEDMEKETYSLKHELVSSQMKLEGVLKDLEERQRQLEELAGRVGELEKQLKEAEAKQALFEQRGVSKTASTLASILNQGAHTNPLPQKEEQDILEEREGRKEELPDCEEKEPGNQKTENEAAAELPAGMIQAAAAADPAADEELARKALQAARKAGSHKGGRHRY